MIKMLMPRELISTVHAYWSRTVPTRSNFATTKPFSTFLVIIQGTSSKSDSIESRLLFNSNFKGNPPAEFPFESSRTVGISDGSSLKFRRNKTSLYATRSW